MPRGNILHHCILLFDMQHDYVCVDWIFDLTPQPLTPRPPPPRHPAGSAPRGLYQNSECFPPVLIRAIAYESFEILA